MILIDPVTGGRVETFTEEAEALLISRGFYPEVDAKADPKPKPKPKPKRAATTTRKRTTKKES